MTTVSMSHIRLTHPERLASLFALPFTWLSRVHRRRELMSLLGQPEPVLKDIGLQRDEITREGLKPFWRA
jgi:uncharacterized protein YjiS (DUF1127 family)